LLLATYLFAFQIYCDFSGYSDIAIGAARMMGFDLMDNFRLPYISKSIKEFWARWHISLSTWFRDYLYIPLGGNRVGKTKWYRNLFLVFLISGIWHGANWTYIVWGALHGFYLIFAIIFNKFLNIPEVDGKSVLWKQVWHGLITFHLVVFAWVFFRAGSIDDAVTILREVVNLPNYTFTSVMTFLDGFGKGYSFISIALLASFILLDYRIDTQLKKKERVFDSEIIEILIYAFIGALIFVFGAFGNVEFIYFQF
jgi:alginate O-acetyltransferase complex protein AlgI